MKIGLIGLGGFGGNAKFKAWKKICEENNHDLYVCDSNLDKINKFIFEGLIRDEKTFSDYIYLTRHVDAVDITTPAELHFEIANYALDKGKHVFVEKPMTTSLEEALKLREKVEETNKVLQVGFHFRYNKLTDKLKELIAEGVLGDLWEIEGRHIAGKRPRLDGGAILSCGVHFIDLILFLTETKVESVSAVSRNVLTRTQTPNEDVSYVHLSFENDLIATVKSSVIDYATGIDAAVPGINANWDLYVSGSKGRAYVDYAAQTLTLDTGHHVLENGQWKWSAKERKNIPVPIQNVYELELKAFIDHINKNELPRANVYSSGVLVQKILDSAYKSAKEGRTIKLD